MWLSVLVHSWLTTSVLRQDDWKFESLSILACCWGPWVNLFQGAVQVLKLQDWNFLQYKPSQQHSDVLYMLGFRFFFLLQLLSSLKSNEEDKKLSVCYRMCEKKKEQVSEYRSLSQLHSFLEISFHCGQSWIWPQKAQFFPVPACYIWSQLQGVKGSKVSRFQEKLQKKVLKPQYSFFLSRYKYAFSYSERRGFVAAGVQEMLPQQKGASDLPSLSSHAYCFSGHSLAKSGLWQLHANSDLAKIWWGKAILSTFHSWEEICTLG